MRKQIKCSDGGGCDNEETQTRRQGRDKTESAFGSSLEVRLSVSCGSFRQKYDFSRREQVSTFTWLVYKEIL
jgi:hypothetical protein